MDIFRNQAMLIVLDGWGVAEPSQGNALSLANTPTIDAIEKNSFATSLQASGSAVGLTVNENGNSEVGHLNLGAGRIVKQYLPRITEDIRIGTFFSNEAFLTAVRHAQNNNARLHIMGLLTEGSVHASLDHLKALLELARRNNATEVVLHLFSDGKDSRPKAAAELIEDLRDYLTPFAYKKPATIIGRVYAMDRNNAWDLTQKAYDALVQGQGIATEDPAQYLRDAYERGITDYDIEPAITTEKNTPLPRVAKGDALIFFNFREDSARQLTKAFALPDNEFTAFPRAKVDNLFVATMTEYEEGLPVDVAYPQPNVVNSLAETLSKAEKTQLHIAETEKYAHVTYFFNGGREEPFPGEERILVPSTGGPHYQNNPEMQVQAITNHLLDRIRDFDFYLINFANADMLGHLGNTQTLIQGIEALDRAIGQLQKVCHRYDIALYITADHGNAENMLEKHMGDVRTRHSGNPVPFYAVRENPQPDSTPLYDHTPGGLLADVAPTILKYFHIPQPPEMTGSPLV